MSETSRLKVAGFQMKTEAAPKLNFRKIADAMKEAAANGAEIIAFPECAISGYPPLVHTSPADIDTDLIAELNDKVREMAAEQGIWVVVGTVLASDVGLLNSALIFSNKGEMCGRYDKLHLMQGDKKFFNPGVGVQIFDMGKTTFGVQICYDARFPEGFRYIRELGAPVTFIISNAVGSDTWKAPVLEGTYRTRAAENSAFIVSINAAGPLQMATSRICDPRGLDLASANVDKEEMLYADLDLFMADNGHFYDRRIDQFELEAKFVAGQPVIKDS